MNVEQAKHEIQDILDNLDQDDVAERTADELDNLSSELESIGNTDLDEVEDECATIARQLEVLAQNLRR